VNTITATGWLVKEAWETFRPSGRRVICFDLMLAQAEGEPAPWRCEMEDTDHAKACLPRLMPGAAVIMQGTLRARPFQKHGVTEGYSRFIEVLRIEFSRLPVAGQETTEERETEKNAREGDQKAA
jgi:hypothetical protein